MIVQKTSIFPASRITIFENLLKLETLQYIAFPYATFTPLDVDSSFKWGVGTTSSYKFKLFGFIPMGIHTIKIERFDEKTGVSSKEGNQFVPVWNHEIFLEEIDEKNTKYTDKVTIKAGWKTFFVWLWANAFYAHRQRRWKKTLFCCNLKEIVIQD